MIMLEIIFLWSIRSDMGIGFTCDLGEIVDSYYDFEKPLLFRLDFPFS